MVMYTNSDFILSTSNVFIQFILRNQIYQLRYNAKSTEYQLHILYRNRVV